jgi:signal transduction histidine kinase
MIFSMQETGLDNPFRSAPGDRMPDLGLSMLRNWRVWLPAVILAEAVAVELEFVIRYLTVGLVRGHLHLLLIIFEGLLISIPVALYVVWRAAAYRAADSYRKLQASEALREDLVNMLVHDLKNSLTSSGSAVELIAMNEGLSAKLSDLEKQTLATAEENLKRAEGMISDILNVAQAEHGLMPVCLAPGDVVKACNDAVAQAEPRARRLAIRVVERYPAPPYIAMMDADKVLRIMDNLLANALRFTPRGGRIEVSVTQADGEVQITVWDNGTPIPEQVRDRIFDKFAQAEASRRHERASIGLGLTFCKMAAEAMGGRIWATSTAEAGTGFTFTLPLAPR